MYKRQTLLRYNGRRALVACVALALIIATLNNGMTLMGVSYFWQLVIKGAVIIIAVLIDKYRTRHHQSA